MNDHFHFLIIVEMVDAPVMLHWRKTYKNHLGDGQNFRQDGAVFTCPW